MATQSSSLNGLTPEQQLANNRLLLYLVLVAETILFSILIYANFMVRNAQGQWPPQGISRMEMGIPIILTGVLLLSSLAAYLGVRALKRSDRGGLVRFLALTLVLGVCYVVTMLGFLSRIPFSGPYSGMFLAVWCVHVGHAVAVLLFMGYVLVRASQGKYGIEEGYFPVEAATNLWHFLDVVWIALFVALYFV